MQVTVSAPAKIHLLGEHAVVYGKPALLSAINKRLYVTVETASSTKIKITTQEETELVKQAISIFQQSFKKESLPPLSITVVSQIPTGCGLGSSAALAAAVIGALMKCTVNIWNPLKINDLAFRVEKTAHGNPSGADNTIVVFGGLVWFRREFEFLKSIWSLPISSYKIPQFVVIDSGRPKESTKEMVAFVARAFQKKPKVFAEIFQDQEDKTKKLLLALREGNKRELIQAITAGEKNLEKIGVVGNLAKRIIRDIVNEGGTAKICGAGGRVAGSGMLLCYHHNLSKIATIGKKYKLPVWPVILGEEGIRIEKVKKDNNES